MIKLIPINTFPRKHLDSNLERNQILYQLQVTQCKDNNPVVI